MKVLRAGVLAVAVGAAACGGGAKKPAPEPTPPAARYHSGPAPGDEAPMPGGQPFSQWLAAIHLRTHDRWVGGFLQSAYTLLPPEHPLNRADLVVTVAIDLKLDGRVVGVTVAKSSGVPDFDAAALEIVKEAVPLPVPPPEAVSDDGLVHVQWSFARDARQDAPAFAAVEQRQFDILTAARTFLAKDRLDIALARLAAAADAGAKFEAGSPALEASRLIVTALLTKRAQDADPFARMVAVRGMGESGLTQAVPQLEKLLGDADPLVRGFAAEALGLLGDKSAFPSLLAVLDHLDGTTSMAAATALAKLGAGKDGYDKVATALAAAKTDAAKIAAVRTLGPLADERALPALQALLRAGSLDVRVAVLRALGELPPELTAKPIGQALKDGDGRVRAAAIDALRRGRGKGVASKALALLVDTDPRVRAQAARTVAELGGAKLEGELARSMKDKPEVVRALADGLAAASSPGDGAIKDLTSLLTRPDETLRVSAATGLAAAGKLDVLATVSADPSPLVRKIVVASTPAAAAAGLTDPAPEVRAAALAVTAAKGDRVAAAKTLMAELAHPDGDAARFAAAWLEGTR